MIYSFLQINYSNKILISVIEQCQHLQVCTEASQSKEDALINSTVLINSDSDLGESLNLDNLLIYLRDQINTQWYQFGLVLGVPKVVLEQLKDYPQDQSLVEMLDYWLNRHDQPSWKDIRIAMKEIKPACKDVNEEVCAYMEVYCSIRIMYSTLESQI